MGIDRDKRSLQALASPRYLALPDPIVQWPRTPPFHGGNTGSNPVRVAFLQKRDFARAKDSKRRFGCQARQRRKFSTAPVTGRRLSLQFLHRPRAAPPLKHPF